MSIYTNTGVVKPTKAWSELQFEAVRVWNVLVTVVRYVYTYELVRVPVRARTNVRVFEQNLLTRAVESTRGHLDELSVQYVLRVLYILALRAPSRVLFSFHSTRPHPFFFFLPIFSFTQAEWCNHTAYTKRVWRTPCNLLLPKKKQTNLIKSKEIG